MYQKILEMIRLWTADTSNTGVLSTIVEELYSINYISQAKSVNAASGMDGPDGPRYLAFLFMGLLCHMMPLWRDNVKPETYFNTIRELWSIIDQKLD